MIGIELTVRLSVGKTRFNDSVLIKIRFELFIPGRVYLKPVPSTPNLEVQPCTPALYCVYSLTIVVRAGRTRKSRDRGLFSSNEAWERAADEGVQTCSGRNALSVMSEFRHSFARWGSGTATNWTSFRCTDGAQLSGADRPCRRGLCALTTAAGILSGRRARHYITIISRPTIKRYSRLFCAASIVPRNAQSRQGTRALKDPPKRVPKVSVAFPHRS